MSDLSQGLVFSYLSERGEWTRSSICLTASFLYEWNYADVIFNFLQLDLTNPIQIQTHTLTWIQWRNYFQIVTKLSQQLKILTKKLLEGTWNYNCNKCRVVTLPKAQKTPRRCLLSMTLSLYLPPLGPLPCIPVGSAVQK